MAAKKKQKNTFNRKVRRELDIGKKVLVSCLRQEISF